MTFKIDIAPAPIQFDEHGTARIGGTRVTLETVLWTFHEGASPEEIAAAYPSLTLTDIYAVITHYLRNRSEVDSYLRESTAQEEDTLHRFESVFPQNGLREKLLAQLKAKQTQ